MFDVPESSLPTRHELANAQSGKRLARTNPTDSRGPPRDSRGDRPRPRPGLPRHRAPPSRERFPVECRRLIRLCRKRPVVRRRCDAYLPSKWPARSPAPTGD
jgi:hypothetical protein